MRHAQRLFLMSLAKVGFGNRTTDDVAKFFLATIYAWKPEKRVPYFPLATPKLSKSPSRLRYDFHA